MTPEKPELPVEMKAAERLSLAALEQSQVVDVAEVVGSQAISQSVDITKPLAKLIPPPKRRRVTVSDIIGPEETREVIEERRNAQQFARTTSHRPRATRGKRRTF